MKKIIYLGSWLILTGTDAILGYKTAVSDFGITDNFLAIIWALGFSLLSVPLKVIYERIVETSYRFGGAFGNSIFLIFSIVWLFVCFQAYTGISDLRNKDMKRLQLETIKQNFAEQKTKFDVTKVENSFDYRLAKKRLNYQAKQDSVILQSRLEQQKELFIQQKKLLAESTGNGFLYFNLLLILSASICLNLGLEEEKQNKEVAKKEEPKIEIFSENSVEQTTFFGNVEIAEPKPDEIYTCNCCKKEFSRHGYNGHFRYSECTKGDFTKTIKPITK